MTTVSLPETEAERTDEPGALTDGIHLVVDALKLNDVHTIYGVVGIPITDEHVTYLEGSNSITRHRDKHWHHKPQLLLKHVGSFNSIDMSMFCTVRSDFHAPNRYRLGAK